MESLSSSSVSDELLSMYESDQQMLQAAHRDPSAWDETLNLQHTARLKEIIEGTGWPTISRVGAEASHAAWTIVQHAKADPAFMEQCLELMKQSGEGEVALSNVAMLEDRIRVMRGEPQLYGTQFTQVGPDKTWEPHPILDAARVDERRCLMGIITTLAENRAAIIAINSRSEA